MFELIRKIFIGLLTGIVSASNHTKWMSLSNRKCIAQPTLINLHPNKYSQEFHYYPFAVKLNSCAGRILITTFLIRYVFQIKQKI